jgi:hypothetical protein
VTIEEVHKLLLTSSSKTSPLDIFPSSILKSCSDVFSPIIATLANKSFNQGVFPSLHKSAQIRPLLKKQGLDNEVTSNYRPISNLTTISKILEKLFLTRLRMHLSTSPNINLKQSAYRSHHSTETALQAILNEVYRNIDKKQVTLLVGLDLSAAFDTIEHSILLNRLEHTFGISGLILDWIKSYITDRYQFVKINENCSKQQKCSFGVPQGSVLGPILFTLYISPVSTVIENFGFHHHQYADDTQLFISFKHSGLQKSIKSTQDVSNIVKRWFMENGLQLNPDKSEVILLGTRQRLATIDLPSVSIAGSPINLVNKIKSLGLTIDDALTFDQHVRNISKSSYSNIRALRQIRSALTQETARSVASAIVSTRLDYCNSLLYKTTAKNISKLQRIQNSLARVVTGHRKHEHIKPILKKLHWLPIKQRIVYKINCLTFKAKTINQPPYLAELLAPHKSTRTLRSSNQDKLLEPYTRTKISSRAFSVSGPSNWNSLPEIVQKSCSVTQFRNQLKTFLFKKAYTGV